MNVKNLPLVIGLAGRKESGKTTIAKLLNTSLKALHEGEVATGVLSFATPLKDMTNVLLQHLGVPDNATPYYTQGAGKEEPFLTDPDNPGKALEVTPRSIMQTLGTDWGRNTIDPNLWARIMERYINNNIQPYQAALAAAETMNEKEAAVRPIIIVGDVRFQNEVDLIHKYGGKVFWVSRIQSTEELSDHISEMSLSAADCDGRIDNTGHIADALRSALDLVYVAEPTVVVDSTESSDE